MRVNKSKSKWFMLIATSLILMTACKPSIPKGILSPGDMEDILYDYHVARAMSNITSDNNTREFNETLYREAMFKKHGVTEAEFDSSLVYYYSRADQFAVIYREVCKRLNEEALDLGASVGEIGKYSSLSLSGDTANIWNNATAMLLIPRPGYNHVQFELKADSTYKKGDSFQFNIMSNFLFKSGKKDATLYMAVCYDNDSISIHSTHCTVTGISTVRVPACNDHLVKNIRTFIYLAPSDESEANNLLFIDQVQLIRFHQKKDDNNAPADEPARTESPQPAPIPLRSAPLKTVQ